MRHVRRRYGILLAVVLGACTDITSGPGLPNQSPTARLLAFRQLQAGVASDLESYLAQHPHLGSNRALTLEDMLARARGASGAADLRRIPGYGPRFDTSDEVDHAGVFDVNGTFEDIQLLMNPSVWSFTKVTIPAVLSAEMSGTATNGGQQHSISATGNTTVATLGYVMKVQLPEINCYEAAADVNTATQHTAGWNIRGFGLTFGSLRTVAAANCPGPQPCHTGGGTEVDQPAGPNTEPGSDGYDPYSSDSGCGSGGSSGSGTQYYPGDNTGGETVDFGTGIGNGGQSACGEAAVVEFVCIDIYNEEGWVSWACGYVTSC